MSKPINLGTEIRNFYPAIPILLIILSYNSGIFKFLKFDERSTFVENK